MRKVLEMTGQKVLLRDDFRLPGQAKDHFRLHGPAKEVRLGGGIGASDKVGRPSTD